MMTSYLVKLFRDVIKKLESLFRVIFPEINAEKRMLIYADSKLLKWIMKRFATVESRRVDFFSTSVFLRFVSKKDLLSMKSAGIFTVFSVVVNTAFSLLSHKALGPFDLIIRFIFFLLGLGALFSTADWNGIKQTSMVFKLINNKGDI